VAGLCLAAVLALAPGAGRGEGPADAAVVPPPAAAALPGEPAPPAPDGEGRARPAEPDPVDPVPQPIFGAGGSAAVPPPGAVLWDVPTFWYLEPEPPRYLRAALELAALQVIALTGYVIVDPPSTVSGTPNPVPVWGKLALRPWGLAWDCDDWTTNFRGHVTSGTLYWLFARGNRLTVLESLAFSAATALLWELVEYKEPASPNDLIVTPLGGMALGEVLVQLGSYLDRSGQTVASQALAWIVTAPKKLSDLMDGAKVRRPARDPGWHRFVFEGAAGFVRQGGGASDWGARLSLGTEIFRAAGYGTEGKASRAMPEATWSAFGLETGFAGGGLYDVRLLARFSPWGWYEKDLEGEPHALRGHDLFAGFTFGLDYFEHDWFLGEPARLDQIECIQLVAGTVQLRGFRDPWQLELRLDAAFQFAGVRPFPASRGTFLPPTSVMPNVVYAQDYYYGFGWMVAPRLEVRAGPLAVGGSWRIDILSAAYGRDLAPHAGVPAALQDRRSEARAWARWRFADQGLEVGLVATRLVRWGLMGTVEESQGENDVVATLGVAF
jgi:hypothetical protein